MANRLNIGGRGRKMLTASLLLVVAMAAATGWFWSTDDAEAQLDITGTWNIEFVGVDFTLSCSAAPVTQSGSSLTFDLTATYCDAANVVATGSITKTTGAFDAGVVDPGPPLQGFSMAGTATATTMSGTWASFYDPFQYSGTFSGTKKGSPTATPTPCPDLDGDTICDDVDLDDDADGCTDVKEQGPNPALGGGRNPLNFWDFFDTPPRDKAVVVSDINRIVGRFGSVRPGGPPDKATALAEALSAPPPAPAYHAGYDRTVAGPLTAPPDGSITVTDISRAVQQFGHNCI